VDEFEAIDVGLQTGPIDQNAAMSFVADRRAGGIALFAGVTRAVEGARETTRLSYDAFQEMVEPVLHEIAAEVVERMDVCRVYVRHRTGAVGVGETSVLIAVSAPHRPAAFEGCRYIIDELKQRAPIWKKEYYSDGGEEWVEGQAPKGQP